MGIFVLLHRYRAGCQVSVSLESKWDLVIRLASIGKIRTGWPDSLTMGRLTHQSTRTRRPRMLLSETSS